MDLKPSIPNVVYVSEPNGSTSPVVFLSNTPNTMLTVRKQSYQEVVSGATNTTYNPIFYKDTEVDENGKIGWPNGSNQSKSTIYIKEIRRTRLLKQFLTSHKRGDEKQIQNFDNDLDRSASGSQALQFNKGLPTEQHMTLKNESVEYLLIKNTRKPRQNSPQLPTHQLLGEKDLEIFIKLIVELDIFYRGMENISTNAEHSNRIVKALLVEAIANKTRYKRPRSCRRRGKSWNPKTSLLCRRAKSNTTYPHKKNYKKLMCILNKKNTFLIHPSSTHPLGQIYL